MCINHCEFGRHSGNVFSIQYHFKAPEAKYLFQQIDDKNRIRTEQNY